MYNRWVYIFTAILVGGFAIPVQAEGISGVSIGAEYTIGDYGTGRDTEIWYFPATIKYESGRYIFGLTVPYLIVTGPGDVVAADGMAIKRRAAQNQPRTKESGLGDVVVSGTTNLQSESATHALIDLTGKVKLGTGDENKGLGTGEHDYAVQIDISKTRGEFILYGTLGYRFMTDPPGVIFQNVFYGTLGGERVLNKQTNIGMALDIRESVTLNDERFEFTGYISNRLNRNQKLLAYLTKGFADGSPDWGVGITVSFLK